MFNSQARPRAQGPLKSPFASCRLPDNFGSSQHLKDLDLAATSSSDVGEWSRTAAAGSPLAPPTQRQPSPRRQKSLHGRPDTPLGSDDWRVGAHPHRAAADAVAAGGPAPLPASPEALRGAAAGAVAGREPPVRAALARAQVARACRLAEVLEAHFCRPGQPIFEALRPLHDSDAEVLQEVSLALAALRGLAGLEASLGDQIELLAASLPSRLCFYWLVAWGLVPAAQAKEVVLWAPQAVHPCFSRLMTAIQYALDDGEACSAADRPAEPLPGAQGVAHGRVATGAQGPLCLQMMLFGRVRWAPGRAQSLGAGMASNLSDHANTTLRQDFFRREGRRANVVLFAASLPAARMAAEYCRDDCLFILQDAGHNPIVLGEELAGCVPEMARRVAAARVGPFVREESGPNAILVPRQLHRTFVDALCLHLQEGDGAHTVKMPSIRDMQVAMAFSLSGQKTWQNAPVFDFGRQRMSPLVTLGHLQPQAQPLSELDYTELCGPVFNVLTYDRPADLVSYFSHPAYRLRQMRASLLAAGQELWETLGRGHVLIDKTVPEWLASASSPPLHAQVGVARLQHGRLSMGALSLARELQLNFICQRSAAAQERQSDICGALSTTFSQSLQELEYEMQAVGRQIVAAWYWGESARASFLRDTPVRCLVVVEPPWPACGRPTGSASAAGRPGALLPGRAVGPLCHRLAERMAEQAQLPPTSGHSTCVVHLADVVQLLEQPPKLLASAAVIKGSGGVAIGESYWRALLVVEALADLSQAFWRPSCRRLPDRFREQARAVYAAWTDELRAACWRRPAALQGWKDSAMLAAPQAQPLVLSNILLP